MGGGAGWRDELDAAWGDIEAWYAERAASHLLHDGATDVEIDRAESQLGLRFPEALRASLRRHNGSRADAWANGTLLGCSSIVAATELWRRIDDHGDDVPRGRTSPDARRGRTQHAWWHRGWIAIDEDGFGNASAVDTIPGPAGVAGQVLDMDRRTGAAVACDDVVEFLREAADTLEDLRVVDGEYLDENDVWEGDADDLDDDLFELVDLSAERREGDALGDARRRSG